MSDEVEEIVEQVEGETEAAQAADPAEESQNAQEKQKAEAFAKKSQDDQDRNWKEARRKMQELEKRSSEQEEIIRRLSQPAQAKEDDELEKLGRDDIITYGQVEKLIEKKAERFAQKAIQQHAASTVEERIQLKYPDFNQVVTDENIRYLNENEPELAESLKYSPDPFKQAVAVYKLLKRSGLTEGDVVGNSAPKEKEKALKNSQKPVSVNAVTKQSAIGNAHIFENGLTKELKASLLKEMRDAAKRM